MKLNNKPTLLKTIIGEVEHEGKVYEVTVEELGDDENDFGIWELCKDVEDVRYLDEVDPDSDLGKELIEFLLIETQDIEQFL